MVQGGDQVPLLLRRGRPEVVGGIMLDKLSHVIAEYFMVMRPFLKLLFHRETVLFGPVNDGGWGHLLMVRFPQDVSNIAVVIMSYRYIGVLYHGSFDLELSGKLSSTTWGVVLVLVFLSY